MLESVIDMEYNQKPIPEKPWNFFNSFCEQKLL